MEAIDDVTMYSITLKQYGLSCGCLDTVSFPIPYTKTKQMLLFFMCLLRIIMPSPIFTYNAATFIVYFHCTSSILWFYEMENILSTKTVLVFHLMEKATQCDSSILFGDYRDVFFVRFTIDLEELLEFGHFSALLKFEEHFRLFLLRLEF